MKKKVLLNLALTIIFTLDDYQLHRYTS